MTKKAFIIICAVVVMVAIGILALAFWKPAALPPMMALLKPSAASNPASQVVSVPSTPFNEYQQEPAKKMSREEAVRLYLQRFNQDHQYDWKVELNFYGKVEDENNQPVVDATAHCTWTTIGVPGNSVDVKLLSDSSGLFSITGQHGKLLEVRVEKEGYDTVEGGMGGLNFEYADPSNPNYHEPDKNGPVIFHLRKKGEGAKLFSKKLDFSLYGNMTQAKVNLMTGFIRPDGQLLVQVNKPNYLTAAGRFPWSLILTMPEGGLYETKQQFPYEAPNSGYTSKMVINMTDPTQPDWSNTADRTYYFYLPSVAFLK